MPEEEQADAEQCSFVIGSAGESLGGNGLPEVTAPPPRKRKGGAGSRASSQSHRDVRGDSALLASAAQSSNGSPATCTGTVISRI